MERRIWALALLCLCFDPVVAAAQCVDSACVQTGAKLTIDEPRSEVLDVMWSSLTGTPIDLTVEQHRALSNAQLSLDDLRRGFAASGIPGNVLSAEVPLPALLQAIAAALDGQPSAAAAATELARQTQDATEGVKLGLLLEADGRPETWEPTRFGVLELVSALCQRYSLEHVTAAHGVAANPARLGLPATYEALELTFVALDAAMLTCGAVGSQLTSAALRVRARATLAGAPVALGVSGVDEASFAWSRLEVVVSIARTRGTLQAIDTIAPAVTMQVTPGVATMYAGTISDAVLLDRGSAIEPEAGLDYGVVGAVTVRSGLTSHTASVRLKSSAGTSSEPPSTLEYAGPFPQTLTLPARTASVADALEHLISSQSIQLDSFDGGFTPSSSVQSALESAVAAPIESVLEEFAALSIEAALELSGQGGWAAGTVVRAFPTPATITCDDGNPCTAKDHCVAGGCRGTPQVGAYCDDSLFCTQGEACDANGACSGGYPRDCSDGLDCTTDRCDEVEFCVSTLESGCLIQGQCFSDGETDPAGCRVCEAASPRAWTNLAAGTGCDDGLRCTEGDQCDAAGSCTGTPLVCADVFSCATETCDEATGACEPQVNAGCLIDGACRIDGSLDPTNPCRYCNSSQSRTEWSPVPQFTRCDDGKTCVVDEMCDGAGACIGVPRNCDDGIPCTVDACDEDAHGCVSTQALAGAPCNDGKFCTVGETCDADGECAGEPRSCADALACTSDSCDEEADRCEHVALLRCVIEQQCIADGSPNPDDNCQYCNAAQSATAWSPRITLECLAMNLQGDPDEDGLVSAAECPLGLMLCPDSDGDGQLDYLDPDDDNDSIGTKFEHADGVVLDQDRDGHADAVDADDDADGVPTRDEAPDADGNADPSDARDTDWDGIPDYLDRDDDGDGLPTLQELETARRLGEDTDGDGLPNYLDDDSDGDGLTDQGEGAIDSDGDGVPDYLQPKPMEIDAGTAGSGAADSGVTADAGETPEPDAGERDADASNDETSTNPATDPGRAKSKLSGGACSISAVGIHPTGSPFLFFVLVFFFVQARRNRT